MARTMSREATPSSSTTTLTLTQSEPQNQETLVLKLKPKKKTVRWKEGTVDNEFMNKKSSKKCCIFHKEKSFDEDDSDEEDDNRDKNHKDHDHGDCCSEAGPSGGN